MEEKEMRWILFGAGDEGIKLANVILADGEEIAFFIDNDERKKNTQLLGVNVISFKEFTNLHEKFRIVIAVSKKWEHEIENQLINAGYNNLYRLEDAYKELKYKSNSNLKKYENMYRGKRCFIIGTGPSLTIDDLETLKKNGEITFASNKIFKVFEHTNWRPNLYCVIDKLVLQQYEDEIRNVDAKHKLIASGVITENTDENIDFFKLVHIPFTEEDFPEFSECPDRYVVEGFTVTYAMIQWALFMGFKEIYLLGIDFDYGSKECGYKHFCANYDKPGEIVNEPRLGKCLMAYKKADIVAKAHDVEIYNASRGGKLDVYTRCSFDKLFS